MRRFRGSCGRPPGGELGSSQAPRAATRAPTQPYYLSPGQGATPAPTILHLR